MIVYEVNLLKISMNAMNGAIVIKAAKIIGQALRVLVRVNAIR